MIQVIADTHAIIWYLFNDSRLSKPARDEFERVANEGDQVGFSTITLAEIVYLSEKGRIKSDALARLLSIIDDPNSLLAEIPLDRTIVQAMSSIPWKEIPDLPDRIIAATALAIQVPIISRDRKIQMSIVKTIW